MAANATFALNAGVWFRRGRLLTMCSYSQGYHAWVRSPIHLRGCPKFWDHLCVPCMPHTRKVYAPPPGLAYPTSESSLHVELRSSNSIGSRASDSWLVEERLQCTR